MTDFKEYQQHFPPEMKIVVGIPMLNNELFRDWAIINEIEEDLVILQLSRDELPSDVNLKTGNVIELRGGKDGQGYRCNGSFVSKGEAGEILVRLTGDISTSELREFYRIDAFLPIKFQMPKTQNLDAVLKEWRIIKQDRLDEEMERKEELRLKQRDRIYKNASKDLRIEESEQEETKAQETEELEVIDHSWDNTLAIPTNISGGGLKFVTPDRFEMDELVILEVFIPTIPPRIMDCVARVVFKNRNSSIADRREYFNVATQFVFIDERDRDAIVHHISNLELMRIRMLRQMPHLPDRVETKGFFARMTPFKLACVAFVVAVLFTIIAVYFINYARSHPGGLIQKTFEQGIKGYLNRFSF